ncbi:MAG: hypothetical protein AAF632_10745 [Bacteroidota bacterium]
MKSLKLMDGLPITCRYYLGSDLDFHNVNPDYKSYILPEQTSINPYNESLILQLDIALNAAFLIELYEHFEKELRASDRLFDLASSPFSFAQWADLDRLNELKDNLMHFATKEHHVFNRASKGLISYIDFFQTIEFSKYVLEDNRPIDELNNQLENLKICARALCDNDIICQSYEFQAYLLNRKADILNNEKPQALLDAMYAIIQAMKLSPKRRYAKYFADYLFKYETENGKGFLGQSIFIDDYVIPCISDLSRYLKTLNQLYPNKSQCEYLNDNGTFRIPPTLLATFSSIPKISTDPHFYQAEAEKQVRGRSGFPLDALTGTLMFMQILKELDKNLSSVNSMHSLMNYPFFMLFYISQVIGETFRDKGEYFHSVANSSSPINNEEIKNYENIVNGLKEPIKFWYFSKKNNWSFPRYIEEIALPYTGHLLSKKKNIEKNRLAEHFNCIPPGFRLEDHYPELFH